MALMGVVNAEQFCYKRLTNLIIIHVKAYMQVLYIQHLYLLLYTILFILPLFQH